jgi:hypothetical protein
MLATANAAGYRYGTADQAFYIPDILHALDAGAFPRDHAMLDVQGRFVLLDRAIAETMRATGLPMEALFLAGYLISLAVMWAALLLIGTRLYSNWWAIAALAAAVTLRHRIPETSANSFEPYFHPRMLAFAIGLLAIAAVLRRHFWIAVGLVAAAAAVHVTTGLWFAVLVGTALASLDRRFRVLAIAGVAALVMVGVVGMVTGFVRPAFAAMDDVWLQAVAGKDSLFATGWPAWAWWANLGFLALLWGVHVRRRRRGLATAEDVAVVWGATALVGLFLMTLPLVAARAALPVQLQISRVFWVVEFVALIYVIAAIAEASQTVKVRAAEGSSTPATPAARTFMVRGVALALMAFSVVRGTYVMLVERPERALFAVRVPDSPWEDTMRWIARQPLSAHVLADPGHAWKHGTSVRVSGGRDVLLEEVKDAALAIYSRDVALRVLDRTAAIGDFASLTADRARELARQYDLDYLVTEADLPLPVAYRNTRFRVYTISERSGT